MGRKTAAFALLYGAVLLCALCPPVSEAAASAAFPSAYEAALEPLRRAHPNWEFVPYETGLTWSAALAGESRVGVNLIVASSDAVWKSTDPAAYNAATGTWKGFDGDKWVAASPAAVAYALDPRNYLDEEHVFAFLTQSADTSQGRDGVAAILAGSCMDTPEAIDAVTAAGDRISPWLLAARLRQEQGVRGNELATGTVPGHEGYFDPLNIKAAAGGGNSAVTNGAIYAESRGWTTLRAAILGGAAYLADGYIAVGQDTLYLQKFDVVSAGGLYTHQYMSNATAVFNESANLKKAFPAAAQEKALRFSIPVYEGLPAAVSPPPGTAAPVVAPTASTTAFPPNERKAGDVDGDGRLSVRDLLIIRRVLLGVETDPAADIDGDGRVTAVDFEAGRRLFEADRAR